MSVYCDMDTEGGGGGPSFRGELMVLLISFWTGRATNEGLGRCQTISGWETTTFTD